MTTTELSAAPHHSNTHKQTQRHTERETERHTETGTQRQTHIHRQTGRQTHTPTNKRDRDRNKHTETLMDIKDCMMDTLADPAGRGVGVGQSGHVPP